MPRNSFLSVALAIGLVAGSVELAFADESASSSRRPLEAVASAEKGTLKNPHTDKPDMIEAGRKLYMSYSCNGCHGGGGGGGMCPPLTNEVWVYGSDDDTLFRLIAAGSVELQKAGYTRKGREGVVGPMPPHGELIKTEDDLWRIITFIRSVWKGDPSRRNW